MATDDLAAARNGDEHAFARLIAPYRRGLHRHCYRMLGRVEDADDALQETLVRVWRGLPRFEPRAPLRAWLYRIATNVALSALASRSSEVRRRASIEQMYSRIGPYPDAAGVDLLAPEPGPDQVAERGEIVELAFVAAVQLLPARQRAVLLLRDVLDFSAVEVAELLDATVAAVNSALQRARAAVAQDRAIAHVAAPHDPPAAPVERDLVERFCRAWRSDDVSGLVRVLVDDAVLTMPPEPVRVVGRGQIADFLVTVPADGHVERLRLLLTRANGQPAVGTYLYDPATGRAVPYAVLVLSLRGAAISSVCRFGAADLFDRMGLPEDFGDDA